MILCSLELVLNTRLELLPVLKALCAGYVTRSFIWEGESNIANNEAIILCLKLRLPISTTIGRCMIAEIMLCLSDCSVCPLL